MKLSALLFALLFLQILSFSGCKSSDDQNRLIIFHAGSLTVPVKQIIEKFNERHPEVKIFSEAAGSVANARKITDLKRNCDVFLSADYNVINKFLIPDFASWNIHFAANEMVIAYHDLSALSKEINQENWIEILMNDKVRFGRSDPDSDPCGYRTLLCMQLAEKVFNDHGLLQSFLAKDTRYMRPKETDLIALLETNTIDYFFIYRSVAVQHNLKYVQLPDSINLKSHNLSGWYANASVEINGKKPGEKIIQTGEPMIYGLTIPDDAPNPDIALVFTEFLLSADGMAIMGKNGQPSLVPSAAKNFGLIPDKLKQFARP
jgi:molybdate/tungstate transport system substrate-binding protein